MTDEARVPKAGDWIVGFHNGSVGHWQISYINRKGAFWKEPGKSRIRFPLADLQWSEQNKCWEYIPPDRRGLPRSAYKEPS